MVRAGVVNHPSKWVHSGYREIQHPPKRNAVVDLLGLVLRTREFSKRASQWVDHAVENRALSDDRWSESSAVGNLVFRAKLDQGGRMNPTLGLRQRSRLEV
jgi:putative transposase